jgi:hypothetical protein
MPTLPSNAAAKIIGAVSVLNTSALRMTLTATSVTSTPSPAMLPTFSATVAKRSPKRRRSSIAIATGESSTISVFTMSP